MLKRISILTVFSIALNIQALNPIESSVTLLNTVEKKLSLPADILVVPAVFITATAAFYAAIQAYNHVSLYLEDGKSTASLIETARAEIARLQATHAEIFAAVAQSDEAAVKNIIEKAPAYGEFWECATYSYGELIAHDLYLAQESVRMLKRRAAMTQLDQADVAAINALTNEGSTIVTALQYVKDFVEGLADYHTEAMLIDQLKN